MSDAERQRRRRLDSLLDEQGTRLYAILARLAARGEVAAELLQELFVRLGQSAGFAAALDPTAYACRAAINLAMEWRRGRDAATPATDRSALAEVACKGSTRSSPLERLVRAEEAARILDALGEVPELPRTCFVLRMIEQRSYAEIAEQMSKTPHQVRGLCHAAVRQLRGMLGERHEFGTAGERKDGRDV